MKVLKPSPLLPPKGVSPKKRMAAQQLSRGLRNKDIAKNLNLNPGTVSRWKKDADVMLAHDEYDALADAQLQKIDAKQIELAQRAQEIMQDRLNKNPDSVPTRVLLGIVEHSRKYRPEPRDTETSLAEQFKELVKEKIKEDERKSRPAEGSVIDVSAVTEL